MADVKNQTERRQPLDDTRRERPVSNERIQFLRELEALPYNEQVQMLAPSLPPMWSRPGEARESSSVGSEGNEGQVQGHQSQGVAVATVQLEGDPKATEQPEADKNTHNLVATDSWRVWHPIVKDGKVKAGFMRVTLADIRDPGVASFIGIERGGSKASAYWDKCVEPVQAKTSASGKTTPAGETELAYLRQIHAKANLIATEIRDAGDAESLANGPGEESEKHLKDSIFHWKLAHLLSDQQHTDVLLLDNFYKNQNELVAIFDSQGWNGEEQFQQLQLLYKGARVDLGLAGELTFNIMAAKPMYGYDRDRLLTPLREDMKKIQHRLGRRLLGELNLVDASKDTIERLIRVGDSEANSQYSKHLVSYTALESLLKVLRLGVEQQVVDSPSGLGVAPSTFHENISLFVAYKKWLTEIDAKRGESAEGRIERNIEREKLLETIYDAGKVIADVALTLYVGPLRAAVFAVGAAGWKALFNDGDVGEAVLKEGAMQVLSKSAARFFKFGVHHGDVTKALAGGSIRNFAINAGAQFSLDMAKKTWKQYKKTGDIASAIGGAFDECTTFDNLASVAGRGLARMGFNVVKLKNQTAD